ncbi:MAG: DNA primase [Firmicutes bacterium]|nr:DNA primase [Bacillota bacterium]
MKYRFPEEFVNRVREANDLVEIASEYMTLTRSGDRCLGLCPFHREDTPSFNISADKQLYHCFGCGAGGNVITFIMNIENLSFLDAVKMLADRCRLPIPEEGLQKGVSERYKMAGEILEANVAAARYYANTLKSSKRAIQYLTDRGLSEKTIRQFGLGYAPADGSSLTRHLKNSGFKMQILQKAGLVSPGKSGGTYERFRDRAMFPIIDVRGRVIGFGGRMMGDGKGAKYLNSSETPVFHKGSTLYGLNKAKKHIVNGELIVVEGYMDVISLYQHGIKNAVASLGTAFTQRQGDILKRYCTSVVVAYDSDAAGKAAALRGMDILQGMGCSVRILQLPEGKDPDDYIKSHGRDRFQELASKAMPLVDYKIDLLEKRCDLNDRGGKMEFLKETAAILAKLESELERAEYIKMIAHRAGVYEATLRKEVLRLAKREGRRSRNIFGKNRHNNNDREITYSVKTANVEAEKALMVLMLKSSKLRQRLAQSLKGEDFTDRLHRELFEILGRDDGTGQLKDADLVNAFDDRQDIDRVVALMQESLPVSEEGIDKVINDCIHTITVYKIRQRSDFLKGEIERLALKDTERTKGEEDQYRGYCKEFVDIQRKLKGQ